MSLQVWLPLTKNVEQYGLSNITVTNNGATFSSNGKLGGCYTVDNFKQIGCSNNITLGNTFSVVFWSKINSKNVDWGNIFKIYKDGYDYIGMCLAYKTDTNPKLGFHIFRNNGSNAREAVIDGYKDYTLNEWFHTAIIVTPTKATVYRNGEIYNTFVINKSFPLITNYSLWLGKNGIGNGLDCSINDFRIYDNALSPREVKEISKGLVLHYPLAMPGQENIIANTSHEIACTYPASGVKDYYSVRTKSVPNETQYTLSFEARSTVDGDHLRTHFYNPNTTTTCESSQGIIRTAIDGNMDFTLTTEWRRYWVVYTQTETTAIKSVICPRLCSPASYPSSQSGTGTVYVRNQKLECGSHPTSWIPNSADAEYSTLGFNDGIEYDVSGYGNNGTKVGTITYDSDTPRYNTSTILNGTYISLASLTNSTISQFSICGWVNLLTGYTANYGCHLINFNKTYCRICVSKDGAALKILLTDGTTNYTLASVMTASSLSANVWNHYAVTFDNGSIKIYINGQLDRSAQVAITAISPSTSSWTIGNHGTTEFPKAKVSDVRFYATALSAADILELYHTPITLSNNGTLLTQGEYVES